MCGGMVLTGKIEVPWVMQLHPSDSLPSHDSTAAHPIICISRFSMDIVDNLVSWVNPVGVVTHINLKLVGSVLQHTCMVDCFDIH